jgi:hypothetical protein
VAKHGSADVGFLLVDGLSVLGVHTEISDETEAVLEEITPAGVAWEKWAAVGLSKATIAQSGFFDDATGSINTMLADNTGAARVATYGYETNALGKAFLGMAGAMAAKYNRVANKGVLTKANGEWVISGSVDEGVIVAPLVARTAAGNTQATKHDNTDPTNGGGYGYLELTALTLDGYTNLLVTPQHSEDDNTYVDHSVVFTARTAVGAQRITLAGVGGPGAMYRYQAVAWSWGGAGTSPTGTWMYGLVRNG